ncbi:DUF1080 domain-containing protein [Flavihumibacter rivuli]|uniref:3-keto-disaccharide hydrolase n=1 Tax=Flavihumibacter rivuli TaxID=2838156 RepID=UPI001BDDF639|nr:DUF1080 domain-containing protein [Flavihumibacter rivuli]ULQ58058.1 DUF1080 domain-containing protein [Flavihumibacter rivuli]
MIRNFAIAALVAFTSCKSAKEVTNNALTAKESKDGWELLFNGKDLKGWHTYGKSTVGNAWQVADGVLFLDASNKQNWQTVGGGDIVTDGVYENYHLSLEWKIAANGNSGIIFNVQEDPSKYMYAWNTGPEMQVLDNNGHPDAKIIKHRAGDLYDLISCSRETVKPAGEWNKAEIIQDKGKLELRLNGVTVVSTSIGDDGWRNMIAGSKFKTMPDFGKFNSGKIALQDHGDNVWYRNIKIRKL